MPLFFPQPQPDVVFSPHAADIAVRDNNGDLVMLPRQNDSWTKKIWQENLGLKALSKREQAELQIADLRCDEEQCIYKNAVTFDTSGNITLDGETLDNSAGGYIYLQDKPHWQPLWDNSARAWNMEKSR